MPTSAELGGIAAVVLAALVCGMLLARLRQPAIVGYILAGVILGPSGAGLVEHREPIALLAELGVLMLLFFVGLRLGLRAFGAVWRLALGGAGLIMVLGIALTVGLSRLLGWSLELGLLLGFVVSLSSTAVAVKMLEDIGELTSDTGRRVIGILIAQDLAIVPMLLVLNALSHPGAFSPLNIPPLVGGVMFLAFVVWYLGRRQAVRLPFSAWVGESDLVPLAALAWCFAAAALSGALGLTAAYGAFVAGIFIGSTTDRRRIMRATEPIQSVLIMVFFLSIGLLIDLGFVWRNLGTVVVLLVLVLVLKSALSIGALRLVGEPWPRAFLSGMLLGQIGEFSFVLAGAGLALGLIDEKGSRLAVTVIALSLMVSPLWLETARRVQALAAAGIGRPRELMAGLYRDEARALADGSTRAATGALRGARLVRVLARSFLRRAEAGAVPSAEPGEATVSAAEPLTPADQPGARDA